MARAKVVIKAETLQELATINCSIEEAAAVLGTVKRTLLRRFKDTPELKEAWEQGRNHTKVGLRRTMWAQAQLMNGAGVNQSQFLAKNWLGMSDKTALELTGKNGGPIQTFDYSKLTDEQLNQIEPFLAAIAAAGGNAGGDQGGTPEASS